jgi:hypothetical protein
MSTATLTDVDTEFYLRTTCPANRRSALQRYLYETADVVDDRVVGLSYSPDMQYNVVVTRHPSEFNAKYQSGRLNSSGEFNSESFDSLEAAMETPEFLQPDIKTVLPTFSTRGVATEKSVCNTMVDSVGAPCILKSGHSGNHRTR